MSGLAVADPAAAPVDTVFQVRLTNFEGPFDLLLALIGRRQLDVTEIALAQVTDDFIAYLGACGPDWDLGRTTAFLVVASTLLDLKAARLLPAAEVEDAEDVARLEARDLLFARLLQYRAYKLSAAHLAELLQRNARRHPRVAELEPRFTGLPRELHLGVDAPGLAELAARALRPRPVPVVAVGHIHAPRVSVRDHMATLSVRLSRQRCATFAMLTADCETTLDVVARFLGLLELFRDGSVAFEQAGALSELVVRWTGTSEVGPTMADSTPAESARAESARAGFVRSVDVDEEYE